MQEQLKALLVRAQPVVKIAKNVGKHHFFIVVVLLLVLMSYGVITVNQTLNKPSDTAYRDAQLNAGVKPNFDQYNDTITKIRNLKKSGENPGAPPPATGRTNPFSE